MSYEFWVHFFNSKLITHTFYLRLISIQRRAQIALAVAWRNKNDQLAGILGPPGHLERGPCRRTRADADHQAFFLGQPPGHLEGVLVCHRHDLVDNACVQHIGHKACPDTLDLMWARLTA